MSDYRLGKLRGRWVVVWNGPDGSRHRWRLKATSPSDARAELREFARERDRLIKPKQKIEEIWADYVAEKQAEGRVSAPRMQDAWKRLGPVFGRLLPGSVSSSLIRDYTAKRRSAGAGDGTIHIELGYLRAALRHSLRGDAPRITLPSKPRPKTRHLTGDEARRLIDGARMPHVRLFIILSLHTAARPSSLLALRWERVEEKNRRILLDDPSRDRTSKGRATVPMADAILRDLQEARSSALTEYVIEWAGKPVGSIKKAIARAAERAGLNGVTPYVLRHTAAVWMAEGGVPMAEIAQYLGHNNVNTTYRVYARYSPDYLRRAGDAISTVLYGTSTPDPVNGTGKKSG